MHKSLEENRPGGEPPLRHRGGPADRGSAGRVDGGLRGVHQHVPGGTQAGREPDLHQAAREPGRSRADGWAAGTRRGRFATPVQARPS